MFTDLHDFTGSDGGNSYAGLILATNGDFYGVNASGGSNQFGTLFQLDSTNKFSVIADFTATNGSYPSASLIQNTNGIIYGAANEGGKITNTGTFYKLSGLASEKPFVSLVSNMGKVGSTVEILGQGFERRNGRCIQWHSCDLPPRVEHLHDCRCSKRGLLGDSHGHNYDWHTQEQPKVYC